MKYMIEIKEVHSRVVEVHLPEDATREQIIKEVNKKDQKTCNYRDLEYSHTLDNNLWTIRNENDDFIGD